MLLAFPILLLSQVGINTSTPQKTLHVNGSLQLTNELNVGGTNSSAGSAGTTGDILISQGNDNAPKWSKLSTSGASGILSSVQYILGTNSINVSSGNTANVPGLTYTITVPSTVSSQTLVFNIIGYAPKSAVGGVKCQGVFSLYMDNNKVTSVFTSVANDKGASDGDLLNLPIQTSLLYQVTLNPGTYTFTLRYTSWAGTATLNYVPSSFLGYNGDGQSMLSRMQVMIFNN